MGGAAEAVVVVEEEDAHTPAAGGAEGRMEGWLYLIRSNRLGLQTSRKRYFVLEDAALQCFKAAPAPSYDSDSSKREVRPPPLRRFVFPRSSSAVGLSLLGGIFGDILGRAYGASPARRNSCLFPC